MKVRLDETLFKARAQENLSMTNDTNKLEQVDALVECLDHFVADRKWVDEISRDELGEMCEEIENKWNKGEGDDECDC